MIKQSTLGPSLNDTGNWEVGEVKNWSKLRTDSTKKLSTWGRGVSKIQKNCRRRLWMVPLMLANKIQENVAKVNCFFA